MFCYRLHLSLLDGEMKPAEKRVPQPDDQKNTEKALRLLCDTVDLNPGIENNIWQGACISLIVNSYIESGLTYQQFCEELDDIKKYFKNRWVKR